MVSFWFFFLMNFAARSHHESQRADAEEIMKKLQEHNDMWTRADAILEQSQSANTKFFALQVGETRVEEYPTSWNPSFFVFFWFFFGSCRTRARLQSAVARRTPAFDGRTPESNRLRQ